VVQPSRVDEPPALVVSESTRASAPVFEMSTRATHAPIGDLCAAGASRAALWASAVGERLPRWWPLAVTAVLALAVAFATRSHWAKNLTANTGVAVLDSIPSGSQVFVDGESMGTTPVTATLAAGSHMVEFRFRKAARVERIDVTRGGHTMQQVDWTLKRTGRLQVRSDPPGANVLVDGTPRGDTPLMLDDLTVGPHSLVLERGNGSIRRSVTVNASETAQIAEMVFPGWVTVFSPFDLVITEASTPIRLDDRHQVMLPPGTHELRFENRTLGYEDVRRVEVRPGAIESVSIVPPRSTMTVTSTTPADVWLDGAPAGQTPLVDLPVDLGVREVVLKTADGSQRRMTTTVTVKPATVSVDFSKPAS
jgi:archaellum component FlaG (FlaF/FlaG flagellin family)